MALEILTVIVAIAFLYMVYGVYKDSKKKPLFFDKSKEMTKDDPLSIAKANIDSLKKNREDLRNPQKSIKRKCEYCYRSDQMIADSPLCSVCINENNVHCCKFCMLKVEKNVDHICAIDGQTYNSKNDDYLYSKLSPYVSKSHYIARLLGAGIISGSILDKDKNERLLDDATHDFHVEEQTYDESPDYDSDSIELDDEMDSSYDDSDA